MKRVVGLWIASLVWLSVASAGMSVSSATGTVTEPGNGWEITYGGVTELSIPWVSNATGDMTATVTGARDRLFAVAYIPASGATQPSASYTVTVSTSDSITLITSGALSNSTSTLALVTINDGHLYAPPPSTRSLTVVVDAAGDSKAGTVRLYFE